MKRRKEERMKGGQTAAFFTSVRYALVSLMAGVTPAVSALDPRPRATGEVGVGIGVSAVRTIGVVGVVERRGGDCARGPDRGARDAGSGVSRGADRPAVVAPMMVAIVRHDRRGQC